MHCRCEVIGNLGRDPVTRFTPSGDAVCNFSVAHSEKWTDKSGQKQERTQWFDCTVWGKSAEACGKYLAKGSLVMVAGPVQLEEYEHQGEKRSKLMLTAREVRFLSKSTDAGGGTRGPGQALEREEDADPIPF